MFLTIKASGNAIYKEKGSKFIGKAVSCSTGKQAVEIIAKTRKENPGCVHVCYAYRLGAEKTQFRFSDDGEPSNSAGAPIFGQIKSSELTNILIMVVRYYGGTKLGVGGLIQAYKTAAKTAILNSHIIEDEEKLNLRIKFTHQTLHIVMNKIKSSRCDILEKKLDKHPEILLSVPKSNQELMDSLKKITGVKII
ncbi:YigZ family protein [Flavobacteriales bacterium]|nr:YigZ family protein [Flavobacteriales bacterium]